MIAVTPAAETKIKEILLDKPTQAFRLKVVSGGCNGFSYLTEVSAPKPSDIYIKDKIVIDPLSSPLLENATLDYIDTLGFSGFKFSNPDASSSCGCGMSFDI